MKEDQIKGGIKKKTLDKLKKGGGRMEGRRGGEKEDKERGGPSEGRN